MYNQHNTYSDEESSKVVDERRQANLKLLHGPSQANADNPKI